MVFNFRKTKEVYEISTTYHSERLNKEQEVHFQGILNDDGTVSFKTDRDDTEFEFIHSDPARVRAMAQAMDKFLNVKNMDTKD